MKKKVLYGIVGILIILFAGILTWKFLKKPDIDVDVVDVVDVDIDIDVDIDAQIQWGMTKEQIKQHEGTISGTLKTESTSSLLYQSRLFGRFHTAVEYEFNNGQLVRRKYMPLEKYLSSEESSRDYGTIRQGLLSHYGEPNITKEKDFRIEAWATQNDIMLLTLWNNTPMWTLEYQKR